LLELENITVWRLCGEATHVPKSRTPNSSARTAG